MVNVPGDSYVHRAAALALVWSELLDDVAPAEECAGLPDLTTRRDQLRRELRTHLERRDPNSGADKWVQRAFWSAPPRRNFLDDKWKEPLLDWVHAMGLAPDACSDVILAVRSLFSDGVGAAAQLASRRPDLMAVVTRTLGNNIDDELCRVAGTHLLEDSFLSTSPIARSSTSSGAIAASNRCSAWRPTSSPGSASPGPSRASRR